MSDVRVTLGRLETENVNRATSEIDRLTPLEMVRLMNGEDACVAAAVEVELPHIARAIEAIAARLQQGGRLIYVGAGTSGRLGVLDAAECPPTFDTPRDLVVGVIAGGNQALTQAVEEVEDRPEAGRGDLERIGIKKSDAVVGITASGRTPYVLGALRYARERGALTIGLAANQGSELTDLVDVAIEPAVGPEVIAGSTRLKAGTAQKMVLNMLSTGVMIVLGKTFGNLMVDVRATNSKLRDRAVRIVQEATGLGEMEAEAKLRAAGGETKTAIVMALAGAAAREARQRLQESGGVVRRALEPRGTDDISGDVT